MLRLRLHEQAEAREKSWKGDEVRIHVSRPKGRTRQNWTDANAVKDCERRNVSINLKSSSMMNHFVKKLRYINSYITYNDVYYISYCVMSYVLLRKLG